MEFGTQKILKTGTIFFLVVMVGLLYFYRFHTTSFDPPQGLHQWRQCVGAGYAMNYYNYDLDIAEARMYNLLGQDYTTDLSFTELPLLYYSVAVLYKICGPDDSIFRIFNALIFLVGLFLLFKTFRFYLKDQFWSLIIVVALFTSPTLVYYTNSFLPNTTAFGFVFMALYFLHLHLVKDKNSHLYLASFFFLLAATTKVTSIVSLLGLVGAFVLMQLFDKGFREKYNYKKYMIPAIIPFAGVLIWYTFAQWFNTKYGATISPLELRAIWKLPPDTIAEIWRKIREIWLNSYFHVSLLYVALGSLIASIVFFRKTNRFFSLVFFLSVFAGTAFFFFFFRSLYNHDYYLINVFIVVLFALINLFYLIKNHLPRVYKSIIFKIAFALLVGYYAYECRQMIHVKHEGYFNATHKKRYSGFIGMETYNRKLGIEPRDFVVSIPDPSIDISLYLMNQPGWTEFRLPKHRNLARYKGADGMIYFISKGAKYLFISDLNIFSDEQYDYLIPYMTNKIGQHKNVAVFDLTTLNSDTPSDIHDIKDDILSGKNLVSTKGPGSFHFKGFKTQYPKARLDTSLSHRSKMHGYNRLCSLSADFFKPNQWYELSFWYYNKGKRPEVNMFINQVDKEGSQDWTDYFSMDKGDKDGNWTLISHYFYCKMDAKTLNFTLHCDSDAGIYIYYSDFLIRQSDADVYYRINDSILFANNRHKVFNDLETFLMNKMLSTIVNEYIVLYRNIKS
ncbi:MAG: ArnT family glycosyltransferase [Bacteroidales bacterium]